MQIFDLVGETGVDAEGCEFADGTVTLRWLQLDPDVRPATEFHDTLTDMIRQHEKNGIKGRRVVWQTSKVHDFMSYDAAMSLDHRCPCSACDSLTDSHNRWCASTSGQQAARCGEVAHRLRLMASQVPGKELDETLCMVAEQVESWATIHKSRHNFAKFINPAGELSLQDAVTKVRELNPDLDEWTAYQVVAEMKISTREDSATGGRVVVLPEDDLLLEHFRRLRYPSDAQMLKA